MQDLIYESCMRGMWSQNKHTHFNITISRGQIGMDTDQSILQDQQIGLLLAIHAMVFLVTLRIREYV